VFQTKKGANIHHPDFSHRQRIRETIGNGSVGGGGGSIHLEEGLTDGQHTVEFR